MFPSHVLWYFNEYHKTLILYLFYHCTRCPKEELYNIQEYSSVRAGEISVMAGIKKILDHLLAGALM